MERARDLARTMEFAIRIGDSVLGPVLAQHLRDAIDRQRTTQQGVSDRIVARMAVGFVDLVGSTQVANQMTSRDLLGQSRLVRGAGLRRGDRAWRPHRQARRRRGHVHGAERRRRMRGRPGHDRAVHGLGHPAPRGARVRRGDHVITGTTTVRSSTWPRGSPTRPYPERFSSTRPCVRPRSRPTSASSPRAGVS